MRNQMTLFRKDTKSPLKSSKGFTLIELVVVVAVVSILGSIATINYVPFMERSFDSTALSDARHLIESVIITSMNQDDVDYTKLNTGGPVGNIDTSGNPRTAVYTLSSGVSALIAGDSVQGINSDTTVFLATVYHTNGTDDPANLSGKREFICSYNEATDTIVLQ